MNLFQRLRETLGFSDVYEEYDGYDEEVSEVLLIEGATEPVPLVRRSPHSKVVGLPGAMMEMVLMQPKSFDDVAQAVTALRERKSVVLNLSLLDAIQAQRCADYVSGGAFAIDGHQRQLSSHVFLFTPSFVHISSYSSVEAAAIQQTAPAQTNPWATGQLR